MKFFSKYGKPQQLKPSKAKTPKQQIKNNIARQRMLLNGQVVLGVKGKPIRSWFYGGTFGPKLGIYGLFGEEKIRCESGKEMELLNDFEAALDAGEFDTYISKVASKR